MEGNPREGRLALAVEMARKKQSLHIGEQSEKLIHGALKYYADMDPSHHEVPIYGYVADVLNEEKGEIFEIQTRSFERLREKLAAFLLKYRVTIIYPVIRHKYICWVEPGSGEIMSRRKSPRSGRASDILPEIYALPDFQDMKNLSFWVILMDAEEYRLQDGYAREGKKGSHRMERLPLQLAGEYRVETAEDYVRLIPEDLTEPFDRMALLKALRLKGRRGSAALQCLLRAGAVVQAGKEGRKTIYIRGGVS